MAQDLARLVFTKRRFASFARRPGSAASGVCRWKILSTIYTKRNRKDIERARLTRPSLHRFTNPISQNATTAWASEDYEDSEIRDRLCFSGCDLGERYQH